MYSIEVKLPRLITADDYHEFGRIEYTLRKLNGDLSCCEVGFDGTDYVGVVYCGEMPGFDELCKLAQEQDIYLGEKYESVVDN